MPKLTPAEIIAEHMRTMRSNGGKAKAARMSREDRVEMSRRMTEAKRLKRDARAMGENVALTREG